MSNATRITLVSLFVCLVGNASLLSATGGGDIECGASNEVNGCGDPFDCNAICGYAYHIDSTVCVNGTELRCYGTHL